MVVPENRRTFQNVIDIHSHKARSFTCDNFYAGNKRSSITQKEISFVGILLWTPYVLLREKRKTLQELLLDLTLK